MEWGRPTLKWRVITMIHREVLVLFPARLACVIYALYGGIQLYMGLPPW